MLGQDQKKASCRNAIMLGQNMFRIMFLDDIDRLRELQKLPLDDSQTFPGVHPFHFDDASGLPFFHSKGKTSEAEYLKYKRGTLEIYMRHSKI